MSCQGPSQWEHLYRQLSPSLRGHCRRVGRIAGEFVRYLLERGDCSRPLRAGDPLRAEQVGRYHDIGKLALPESIWTSDRPLTAAEKKLMWAHPLFGAFLICGRVQSTAAQAEHCRDGWRGELARCCQCHHERWDGTGYPLGLAGEEIPLLARVVGIADSYDAMTQRRPYRDPLSREAALMEIRQNGGRQFDPLLADLFCQAMEGMRPS
ncbi:HD-GYP domain-containing protein [Bittarella massiliensis (ex Durand et al. 2017)]|uniref:HD-GYP domain-containing protein n=1 Tax=Bittarella massiliensis (ex Durand et al. 2017) TaxID=1720313 RepID=UPI001AA185AE|nr:HD domain-containing phosphohydrolase [Bittarella massiliensis (ex Durand et al. 2017)]MBO1679733.1 HD domain-containing protein [Bittarella massiliensis (ex Durand et al. 2017)]